MSAKESAKKDATQTTVAAMLPMRGEPDGMPLAVANVRARGGHVRVLPASLSEELDTGTIRVIALMEGRTVNFRYTAGIAKFFTERANLGIAATDPAILIVDSFEDTKQRTFDGRPRVVEYLALKEEDE
jgi:hypothetical protein